MNNKTANDKERKEHIPGFRIIATAVVKKTTDSPSPEFRNLPCAGNIIIQCFVFAFEIYVWFYN